MKKNFSKFFIFVLMVLCFAAPNAAYAKAYNVINIGGNSITGRFDSLVDGLIVMTRNGVRESYIRTSDASDPYPDYVTYKVKPIFGKKTSLPCRVTFIDTWIVKFATPKSQDIEIPRYRVLDIEINMK